jgi:hypothetical protein
MSSRVLIALVALAAITPASASASASHRCYSSQLAVTPGRAQGAAGSVGQTVQLRNLAHVTCTLEGYPGMLLLNASGHALPTVVHRGASVTVSARPVSLVTLTPGQSAAFDIGYASATGYANKRCPTSTRVEITPPNDFAALTINWRLQPFGGTIEALRCGLINVSPVYAG